MTRIAVRSRRQAMDWSLVLVSQGIETTIERPSNGDGWALLVAGPDAERAFKTLRQYREENRDWPWRQPLPWSHTRFDWACLMWAGLVLVLHWLGANHPAISERGVMDSHAVFAGQWWRVFTAMTLHADLGHLVANLGIGILLLGLTMARYGTGTGMLASFAAGTLANVASLLINTGPFYGLGASGMVMGALGLLSAQTLRWSEWKGKPLRYRLGGVAAGVMLFALYGVAPDTDIVAHFGGFVSGLILGGLLNLVPAKNLQSTAVNVLSGLFLAVLLGASWLLVLAGICGDIGK